jgi:hypothetical protein
MAYFVYKLIAPRPTFAQSMTQGENSAEVLVSSHGRGSPGAQFARFHDVGLRPWGLRKPATGGRDC